MKKTQTRPSFATIYTLVLFVFFQLLLQSCDNRKKDNPLPLQKITVSAIPTSVCLLLYLARDMHFFEQQGLQVMIEEKNSGSEGINLLIADKIDMATSTEAAFIPKSFSHSDLKILATISHFKNKSFLARPSKGLNSPTDLQGKKIGVTRNTGGEYFLSTFLEDHNMSFDDVDIVDLKPNDLVKAMSSGELDGCLTWEPFVYKIKKELKDDILVWNVQEIQNNYFVLSAKKSWLYDNYDLSIRFLKGLNAAEEYLIHNQEKVKRYIRQTFQEDPEYALNDTSVIKATLELPQALLLIMDKEAQWRLNKGLNEGDTIPNFLQMISFTAMENAKPSGITIYR